jgi:hypothetical protein
MTAVTVFQNHYRNRISEITAINSFQNHYRKQLSKIATAKKSIKPLPQAAFKITAATTFLHRCHK